MSVAINSNGDRVVSGSGRVFIGSYSRTVNAVITGDLRKYMSPGDNTVRVWDVETGVELARLRRHSKRVSNHCYR